MAANFSNVRSRAKLLCIDHAMIGLIWFSQRREFWCCGMRVFPSYIMTGKNILIEKSKFQMAADDIRRMLQMNEGKGIA